MPYKRVRRKYLSITYEIGPSLPSAITKSLGRTQHARKGQSNRSSPHGSTLATRPIVPRRVEAAAAEQGDEGELSALTLASRSAGEEGGDGEAGPQDARTAEHARRVRAAPSSSSSAPPRLGRSEVGWGVKNMRGSAGDRIGRAASAGALTWLFWTAAAGPRRRPTTGWKKWENYGSQKIIGSGSSRLTGRAELGSVGWVRWRRCRDGDQDM